MPTKNPQQASGDYTKNAKNLDGPTYNSDLKQTVVNAIFTGFNQNILETEAFGGKMTFVTDSNTIFQSLTANPGSNATNGGILDSGQIYNTPDTFANQVPKGSLLQIFYTEGQSLKAVKVNYVPDYKFK